MNRGINSYGATTLLRRQTWLQLLVLVASAIMSAPFGEAGLVKEATFLSPKFVLSPGSAAVKFYTDIDFPRGHIAIKSFNAEVVDEEGNPVSLQETYLHHWMVARYYQQKDVPIDGTDGKPCGPGYTIVSNSGVCQNDSIGQYFGLGSETRKTETHIPDPYGIEVGKQEAVPDGFEERWMLNIHAIDVRGVKDPLGCTECRCDLYNVTRDQHGRPLVPGYKGGQYCCYDQTQCRLKEGFQGTARGLYLKYTVQWVDWETSILPVKIYIFDATDIPTQESPGLAEEHHCRLEYDVESGNDSPDAANSYVDIKRSNLVFPSSGYMIYGVGHQHWGGLGANLYGKDGRLLCSSVPRHGRGNEPGDEAGYVVGMSTCYPEFGSVHISEGEVLTLESNYSSKESHTGVMCLFYLLLADELPNSKSVLDRLSSSDKDRMHWSLFLLAYGALSVFGVLLVGVAAVAMQRPKNDDGYRPLVL